MRVMSNYYTAVFHLYKWKYQLKQNLKTKSIFAAIPHFQIPFTDLVKSLVTTKTGTAVMMRTAFGILYFVGLMITIAVLFS